VSTEAIAVVVTDADHGCLRWFRRRHDRIERHGVRLDLDGLVEVVGIGETGNGRNVGVGEGSVDVTDRHQRRLQWMLEFGVNNLDDKDKRVLEICNLRLAKLLTD